MSWILDGGVSVVILDIGLVIVIIVSNGVFGVIDAIVVSGVDDFWFNWSFESGGVDFLVLNVHIMMGTDVDVMVGVVDVSIFVDFDGGFLMVVGRVFVIGSMILIGFSSFVGWIDVWELLKIDGGSFVVIEIMLGS